MHPLEIPTSHTLAFVLEHLPVAGPEAPARRVLEVGAGDGRLARAMIDAGHNVVAIDLDRQRVSAARSLGVESQLANWLEYEPAAPFDAILFSRSLHHISPLEDAVTRAIDARFLAKGGRVIVEDFAFHEMEGETIRWLATTLRRLITAREIKPARESLPARLGVAHDPVAVIEKHRRQHHIHAAADIRATLASHATITHESEAPYLYRWVAAAAAEQPKPKNPAFAADLVEQILTTERRLIESRQIKAIGRRFVATRNPVA